MLAFLKNLAMRDPDTIASAKHYLWLGFVFTAALASTLILMWLLVQLF